MGTLSRDTSADAEAVMLGILRDMPAWRRLEPNELVTGNEMKNNLFIGGINGFNLVAAMTAPMFIFPQLGLGGPLAWIGLVWIPVVFSTLLQ